MIPFHPLWLYFYVSSTTVLLGGNGAVLFEPQCASSWISLTLVLLHVSPTSRLPPSDSRLCQAAKPSSVVTVTVHCLTQIHPKNERIDETRQTGKSDHSCVVKLWIGSRRGNIYRNKWSALSAMLWLSFLTKNNVHKWETLLIFLPCWFHDYENWDLIHIHFSAKPFKLRRMHWLIFIFKHSFHT